eukprot:CAMPEP_0171297934 /NCGR_PEP_ID=MMETSP0816-20121228/6703_1 /TAXON_ID=420281 /ORGANISM="Proboscia inermis, Strain CCAP1064/1" /LENGTH=96 /DNA_ID=CAMNT_0011772611 /DNA_START=74 /DNA_END=364 /DNA_ORIENTATION=+
MGITKEILFSRVEQNKQISDLGLLHQRRRGTLWTPVTSIGFGMSAAVVDGVFADFSPEVLENGFDAALVLGANDVDIENPAFHDEYQPVCDQGEYK